MSSFSTAKEALLVEAIGQFSDLLDQADRVQRTLTESSREMAAAQARLNDHLAVFDTQVNALTERAKVLAVKHIITRTEEAARQAVDVQTRAMAQAGREVFEKQLQPELQRVAQPLWRLVQRLDQTWVGWCTHAAAASLASFFTFAITIWMSR